MTARAEAAVATGERLLAAAWRHFATRPYEEVRLRDVATEAGVTPQTLHARFGSKRALFVATYAWFAEQEMSGRPPVPIGDVAEAIAVLFDRYEQHGQAILRMLTQEERIPTVHLMTEAGRAYHRQWVEATFAPLLQGSREEVRERRLAAIVAATDLLVWKILRQDMGLGREQAERVMADMIQAPAPRERRSSSSSTPTSGDCSTPD